MPLLNDIRNVIGSKGAAGYSGLLDSFPSASRAYALHLLRSDYSGALVRIRKDTAGQPEKDFYPDSNNELSLSSTDGAGTTLGSWIGSDSGYVVTWYDQSGNAQNATQSTTANQPQIISSGSLITQNGKAAMDANMDWLTFTQFQQAAATILSVVKSDVPDVVTGTIAGQSGSLSNWIAIHNTQHSVRINGTEVTFPSSANTSQQILCVFKNSTNGRVYKNGASLGTTSSWGAGNVTMTNIGAIFSGARYLDGRIQALIIWPTDLIASESELNASINEYYGAY